MTIDKKKLTIQILAIFGLILTVKLALIYYTANYQKYALASFCSINEFIDCDGAAKTTTAQFWGIPLAYWGMLFYFTVIFLTVVDKLKNIKFLRFLEVFKNPNSYITFLGTIAFLISMILAGISVFRIHKLCILCVITYLVDFGIALTASSANWKGFINDFKTTYADFIDGAKKYKKTFITLIILSASFLTYTNISCVFVPHIKTQKEFLKYRKMKANPYKITGNVLGNENADVVVELYSDYVCPMCYIHNIMLHKAAKEFSNIKIVHHNIPFDKECNPYISFNMHPKACFMAKAALAAEKQNNYWGMASLLYEKQPKNQKEAIKLAKKIGLNEEQFISDINSSEIMNKLKSEIEESGNRNIDSTPTMYVNKHKVVGIMPYKKLRNILIKNGAKN